MKTSLDIRSEFLRILSLLWIIVTVEQSSFAQCTTFVQGDTTILLGDTISLTANQNDYFYDFESGAQGWTSGIISGTTNTWALASTAAGSSNFNLGSQTFGTPNIGDLGLEKSYIISPALYLNGTSFSLSFESYSSNEGGYPTTFDVEFVEYSIDGGTSWIPFFNTSQANLHNYADQTWRSITYGGTAAPIGNPTYIRFRYDTGDGCCGPTDISGWYLDNVAIKPAMVYDFNTGTQGWASAIESGTVNTWALASTAAGSSSFNLGSQTYGTPNIGNLGLERSYIYSPSLDLNGNDFKFTFDSYSSNESGYPDFYDVEYVEYSTDGGSTWIPFFNSFQNDLHNYQDTTWRTISYNGTGSSTTRFRFRYDTGDGCCGPTDISGWYLDNIIVDGTAYSWGPNVNLSATNTQTVEVWPDTTTTYTVTVTNSTGCVSTADVTIQVLKPDEAPGSGYAVAFDGSNEGAQSPVFSTVTDNFTLEGWFKPSVYSGGNQALIYNGNTSTSGWGLMMNGIGQLTLLYGGNALVNTGTILPLNQWSHVALVRNAGTASVFVNGIQVYTGLGITPATPVGLFTVGRSTVPGEFFSGHADEVRLWETALSANDIRNGMCQKLEAGYPNYNSLVGYYRLDHTTNFFAYDYSDNGNYLSLDNAEITDWVISGAPIGDTSVYAYSATPNLALSMVDGDTVVANDFSNTPDGAHLYVVNESPLNNAVPAGYTALEDSRYFGVFTIGGSNPGYALRYNYANNLNINGSSSEPSALFLNRDDASSLAWSNDPTFTDSVNNQLYNCRDSLRREFIVGFVTSPSLQSAAIAIDTTAHLDSSGMVVIDPAWINNGSFDYCAIDSMWIDADNFGCASIGANQVVLFMRNDLGMVFSDTAVVTVIDTIAPNLLTQDITVYLNSFGSTGITPAMIDSGSWDSCGISTLSIDIDSFNCSDTGLNTVIFSALDVNGNTSLTPVTVTVLDTIDPVVITQNITVYLDINGQFTLVPDSIDNGSWDGCGISLSIDTYNFSCANVGSPLNVTLTGTDPSGNSASAVALVTVLDTFAPTLITQNLTVYLDSMGDVSITSAMVDNGTWDSCGIDTMYLSNYDFTCGEVGVNSITFFAEDVNGNVDSTTVAITVVDSIAPHLLVQDLTVYLDSLGSASITPAMIDMGTWDSCGINLLSIDINAFSCADVGSNTVTFTADDVNSNTSITTVTVTVLDTIAPVMLVQNASVYLDINGQFTLTPAVLDNGSWDSCGISLDIDTANFSCANTGSPLNVTLTGTDPSGNSASAAALVTVLDTFAPMLITQNLTVYLDSMGDVSITPAMVDNGTWDSCGIDTLYLSNYDFTCGEVGVNSITFFAEDVNGNVDSTTVSITVVDSVAPHLLVQDLTVYLDSLGSASITPAMIDIGTWDSCGINSLSIDINAFSCADVGSNTVTFTADDVNGNTSITTVTVTVLDTIAPVMLVQNTNVYLDINGQFTLTPAVIDNGSWDSCGISLDIDTANFSCANVGSPLNVTLTGTDPGGNSASAAALVTVLDTFAPTLITQNLTVYLDSMGDVSITPAMVDNGTWDSCGIDTLYLSNYDFTCGEVGVNSITFFAEDVNGNLQSTAVSITVLDTIAPLVQTQDITVYLNTAGTYTLLPSEIDNGSWDSCGIASYVLDTSNFTCADTGSFTVTMTLTDVNGNVNSATALVTLEDTTSPVMQTQNITVYLDATGNVSITPAMIDNGSGDNCAIDSLWLDDYDFSCADTTSQTVILTAMDVSGNSASLSAVVSILDTIAPVVLTQNLVLYLNQEGESVIGTGDVDNGSTDNCDIDSLWLSDTLFECADTAAINTITLFVRDVSGNVNSATATVEVFDTIAPTVTAQNLLVYLDSFGNANIFPSQVDSNSLDNCGIDSSWISQNAYDCSHAGDSHTVFLFIRDISGNMASDSALVSVFDTIAPEVNTQNITIYLDSFGLATIDTSMVNNGSWDACGIDTMWLSQYQYQCAEVGINTVTLFAEDLHGNVHSNTATVTVEDTIAPQIITQNLVVYLDSYGLASITADSMDNGTWDSCGVASISIDSSNFACVSHGDTITIVFTAEDVNGNISVDSAYVYVFDTLPPVVLAVSDTIFLDSNGQFIVDFNTLNNGTSDNCAVGSMYLSDSTFNCANVDSTWQIYYIAEDIYGNSDSIQVSITVIDTIHPAITCPSAIIVNNDTGQCGAVVSFSWPTAWDNCTVDSIVQIDTTGLDSAALFPVGITELVYVAYDQSGNTDTCSFTIEVQDWEVPQLFCQADTLICDTTYIFDLPAYTDNCGGFEVLQIAGIASGQFYPVGSTINRFAVSDAYGNTDTCEYEVFRYDFPSLADAGEDQEKCEEFTTVLSANNPAIGQGFWKLIEGNAIISDTLDHQASLASIPVGITLLEWRIENGVCPVERDTMTITEYANPTSANAGPDQIVCDTTEGRLGAIIDSIGSGTWLPVSNGTNILDSSAANSVVTALSLGSFSYVWKVENGVCPITYDTVNIDVKPYTSVDAGKDKFIFYPSTIELEVTSELEATYTWSPSSALESTNGAVVVANPQNTTTYVVMAETEFGCRTRDTVMVGVNIGPVLPTAFTPDGDNYNDVWNLKELESYPGCVVKVYNRWGHLMFESNGYEDSWDGKFKGEDLPSGSYFYVIELNVEEVPPQTGSVTIIR